MASIDSFRAQLKGGGARANQFEVIITVPSGLGGASETEAINQMRFMARGAQLPASAIPVIPVSYRGRTTKVAGDREFEPWTITVYNDNDFAVRNMFEAWMANIANHGGSGGLLTSALYQSTMIVKQLDRNDIVLKTYEFKNAFPTNVAAIELSFDAQSTIEEFSVTFDYDYWTTGNVDETLIGSN